MKKFIFLLILILFFVGFVSAACDSGQIDINSASATELDKLYGIGPAKAQSIIGYRSQNAFEKVDDLIEVNGIGEVTLSNIKVQGLACVVGEETDLSVASSDSMESSETSTKEINQRANQDNPETFVPAQAQNGKKLIALQTINLNTQDIKSEENLEEKGNGNRYAFYGLIAFSLVLALLFTLRAARKNKYKNEFV
ncbi:MAG: helix-hairpin-helix domain-containing protein [Nanoarchaeota archaeon]|nr:helix-hairpin-helix domain-containing protein [Nanoarchaeota archaeon]MBU1501635.1 helix-hairpin-helix domain-containing protein [Nanoarchaeota archaeon]MBU2458905.1 helix-hairpin-helix domain-containing protein [Nanoarchaeota archaeon]